MECISRVLRETFLPTAILRLSTRLFAISFAVRSDDVMDIPATLSVIGESRAFWHQYSRQKGQCCESPNQRAAFRRQCCRQVENTEGSRRVQFNLQIRSRNESLLQLSAESRKEIAFLRRVDRLAADVGLLAGSGKSSVLVSRKPRVAIIATETSWWAFSGCRAKPNPQQQQLHSCPGARCGSGATHSWESQGHRRPPHKIRLGLEHDILLVSGGVSMGRASCEVFRTSASNYCSTRLR